MNNANKRVLFMSQYTTVSEQMGKLDGLYKRVMDEPDLDRAIDMARSMRGHVGVILKALHSVRRGDDPLKWLKEEEALREREAKKAKGNG